MFIGVGPDGTIPPGGDADDTILLEMSTTGASGSFTLVATLATGFVDQPSVAVGHNSVWVTYNQGGTIFARGAAVTGLGAVGAFTAAQAATGSNGVGGQFGDIAINPATGAVAVTYQSNTTIYTNTDADGLGPGGFGAQHTASSTAVAKFYSIPAQASRTIDAEANLAYDPSGTLYMAYTDVGGGGAADSDIFVRRSVDDGVTWSPRVEVSDEVGTNSQFLPQIAVDLTTGFVGVSWYDARFDNGQNDGIDDNNGVANDEANFFASISTDGGATFLPNVVLTPAATNANGQGIVEYGDYSGVAFFGGVLRPIWSDNSNSTGDNPAGKGSTLDQYTTQGTVQFTGGEIVNVLGDEDFINEDDTFWIVLDPSGTFIQFFENGTLKFTASESALTQINVFGFGGNDSLTLDFGNGSMIPDLGLTYNGGSETGTPGDSLRLIGTGGLSATYTPSATTPGEGTVSIGGRTVTFSDLEPVVASGFASFTLITPNSADVLTVDSPAAGRNRVSGSSDGVAFESLTFFDTTSVALNLGANDGASPDDAVSIDASGLVASGLQNFTINTGIGVDTLTITASSFSLPVAGGVFTFNAGPDIDLVDASADVSYTLTDTSLGIAGDGSIALVGFSGDRATLTGGGSPNSFTVSNWTSQATLDGAGSGDTYTVTFFGAGSGTVTINDSGVSGTDQAIVNGTAGPDTLVVTPTQVTRGAETVNYSGIEELTVDADGGNDSVTVNGTQVPTTVLGGAGDDAFTVNATGLGGPLYLDGQEDSDTYTVSLGAPLAAPVTIKDTGTTGTDTLAVNGTPSDDTIILTDSGVTGGGGAGITFSGIEAFAVDAGAGNDLVDGSALTIPVSIFGGTGNDTLIGGSGDDSLFGEEDDDDLIGGLGADLLDGGAGSDGLVGDKGSITRELLDGSTATTLETPNGHLTAEINQAGMRRLVTLLDPEFGGNDTMLGGTGNDYLHGGAGNDEMEGGDDNDALFGDLGDDSMVGGAGSDHLFGGRGNDSLDGGAGADIAYGGDGDDRLIADVPGDRLIDWFGNFNDFVIPGPSYGGPTIVRSPGPWVRQFLLDLALADGALDPNGEIAVVIPGSPDQQDNSGKGGRVK